MEGLVSRVVRTDPMSILEQKLTLKINMKHTYILFISKIKTGLQQTKLKLKTTKPHHHSYQVDIKGCQ